MAERRFRLRPRVSLRTVELVALVVMSLAIPAHVACEGALRDLVMAVGAGAGLVAIGVHRLRAPVDVSAETEEREARYG